MTHIKSVLSRLKRPIQGNNYVPEIDVLRFIAIISVMFLHLSTSILDDIDVLDRTYYDTHSMMRNTILKRFGLGVELFFAISGFVIARPFIGGKNLNIKKYFIRRFIRIEPPYIIALLIFALVHFFLGPYSQLAIFQHLSASILYLHNIIYNSWSAILPVAWSLEVEFQFYLIAPIFFLLLFRLPKKWQIIVLIIFIFLSFYSNGIGWGNITNFYGLFLIGILAAYPYHYFPNKRNFIFDVMMISSLIALFFIDFGKVLTHISILLIMISFNRLTYIKRIFSSTLLSTIGAATYTLYLLHYPLFKFVNSIINNYIKSDNFEFIFFIETVILLPLSIILMLLYYFIIERYFMTLSQKYR
jgi:peptidoglycan/LPS O-acetylase OafA/YrhL